MVAPNPSKEQLTRFPLQACLIIGAGIGLILMGLFLAGVTNPDPSWGSTWMLRPLVFIANAGAAGGAFYYYLNRNRQRKGWRAVGFVAIGFAVYIACLFFGAVLGLDGTLWD